MALSKTELQAASKYGIGEALFKQGKQKWLQQKGMTEQQAFALNDADSLVISKTGIDSSGFLEQKRADIEMEMAEVGHALR